MKQEPHRTELQDQENYVKSYPASPESVGTVLDASVDDDDGRSQFMWVRLGNGDLILGVFPQGDTYFATEGDHNE
jgi:hypothetical protein